VQLVLVRHALPERVGRPEPGADDAGPRADPGLTELGQRQAARLVDALGAGAGAVDALYCSPLARARATAAPLARALGREPVVVDGLREYDAEARYYVPVHEMARHDPAGWQRILDGHLPDHVDVDAFTDRVGAAVEEVVAAHPGRETAVVVAHAGTINVWLRGLLGLTRPLTFPLDYTGITRVLAGRDGRRVVRSVNETGHVADLLIAPTYES
jgi:2,3-bisphosphoglycerate-dependent phosphoglycerate mutase